MKKAINTLQRIIEVYIPSISILLLLFAFVIGIISRYIIKDPQTWTYEVESITFFIATMTSVCLVNRSNEHVVFDMFYNNFSDKKKCISRILTNILVIVFAAILLPYSLKFISSMFGLYTQVIKIPRWIPFITFPLVLCSTIIYSLLRLIEDIKSYKDKTYIESYKEVNE